MNIELEFSGRTLFMANI